MTPADELLIVSLTNQPPLDVDAHLSTQQFEQVRRTRRQIDKRAAVAELVRIRCETLRHRTEEILAEHRRQQRLASFTGVNGFHRC